MNPGMRRACGILVAAWLGLAPWCAGQQAGDLPPKAPAEMPAPEEVVKGAMVATSELGDRVARGELQYAYERMYPRWRERMAKRNGGAEAMEQQLRELAVQMQEQGVSILSVKVAGAVKAYSVWPKRSVTTVDGKPVESVADSRWVVLVPTVTRMRIRDEGVTDKVPRFRVIDSSGFQVAVSEKDPLEWFFIDGSGVTVADLRSLFPTLPGNIQLPVRERREVKP
jgi:hypothetical protein